MIKAWFTQSWRVLVTAVFLVGAILIFIQDHRISPLTRGPGGIPPESQIPLNPELQQLIAGVENSLTRTDELHFARYLQNTGTIPADFHEVVEALAPDNAWFDLWEITQIAPLAFEGVPSDEDEDEPDDWIFRFKVTDAKKMDNAIALLHQAAQSARYTSYAPELRQMLLSDLPAPETYTLTINHLSQVAGVEADWIRMAVLGDFIVAALQETIKDNDKASFQKIEESFRNLTPRLLKAAHSPFELISLYRWMNSYSQLALGAEHFELPDKTIRYRSLAQILSERDEEMAQRRSSEDWNAKERLFNKHGSLIANLALASNFTTKPFPITASDLEPSCRVENAFYSRSFVVVTYLFLIICAAFLWFKMIMSSRAERVAARQRIDSSAHWRMLTYAVLLPFFGLLAIRYLTPLGQLNYSVSNSLGVHIIQPLITIALCLLTTTILCARRLVDAEKPAKWPHFAFLVLPFLAIILMGCFHLAGHETWFPKTASFLTVISFLWISFIAIRQGFENDSTHQQKRHLALPAVLLAAGLFGIFSWALSYEERYWSTQDEFFATSSAFVSKHEERMAKTFKAELAKALP